MIVDNLAHIIPERTIVNISPHYDDFLFFTGGYVSAIRKTPIFPEKHFINVSTFSRSNYQARDELGNADQSLKRVQYATGIRLIEDLQCLDDLLGFHNYEFRILGEEESQVRGNKVLNVGDGEMEMAIGSYEIFEDCDWAILDRIRSFVN